MHIHSSNIALKAKKLNRILDLNDLNIFIIRLFITCLQM